MTIEQDKSCKQRTTNPIRNELRPLRPLRFPSPSVCQRFVHRICFYKTSGAVLKPFANKTFGLFGVGLAGKKSGRAESSFFLKFNRTQFFCRDVSQRNFVDSTSDADITILLFGYPSCGRVSR